MALTITQYQTLIIESISCDDTATAALLATHLPVIWSSHNIWACHRDFQYLLSMRDGIQLALDATRMNIQRAQANSDTRVTSVYDSLNRQEQFNQASGEASKSDELAGSSSYVASQNSNGQSAASSTRNASGFTQLRSPFSLSNRNLSTVRQSYSNAGDSRFTRQSFERTIDNLSGRDFYGSQFTDRSFVEGDLLGQLARHWPGDFETYRQPLIRTADTSLIDIVGPAVTSLQRVHTNFSPGAFRDSLKSVFVNSKYSVAGVGVDIASRLDSRMARKRITKRGVATNDLGDPIFAERPNPPGWMISNQVSTQNIRNHFANKETTLPFTDYGDMGAATPAPNSEISTESVLGSGTGQVRKNIQRDARTVSQDTLTANSNAASSATTTGRADGLDLINASGVGQASSQHSTDGVMHAEGLGVSDYSKTVAATVVYLNQLFDNLQTMYKDVLGELDALERQLRDGAYALRRMIVFHPRYNYGASVSNSRVIMAGIPCGTGLLQGAAIEAQRARGFADALVTHTSNEELGMQRYEAPAGTINGVNAVFTIARTPNPIYSLQLYRNGVLQRAGAGNDYTLALSTITFEAGAIPQTGDVLYAIYLT